MADEKDQKDPRQGPVLTHSQCINRLREVQGEIERIGELDAPSAEDEKYFDELTREFDETDSHRKHLERQSQLVRIQSAAKSMHATNLRVERGSGSDYDKDSILEPDSIEEHRFRNPWDLSEMRTFDRPPSQVAAELRSRALSAMEKMQSCSDNIRQAGTEIIERWDDQDGKLSRLALALSEPTYLRAWSKLAVDPNAADLEDGERAAIGRVRETARAMSLTDSAGGYLVPFQLDPTVIITANGSVNQIRQLARQVVATGDVWNGVSSGAVSWSYDAEAAEVSDDSTTFAQPTVPIYKAAGFVPISIEAIADAQNVAQEVGTLLAFGRDVLESAAFATGSGSAQPTGIVTALVAASTPIVNSAGSNTFALADVYALHSALPARYRNMPSTGWLANNLTYNLVRQFDTAGGNGLWAQLGDGTPARLLNKTVLESEDMDATYGSGENYTLVFGDFSNYVIADRIGMTVEFIPHLFSTSNGRPKGQRGWYAYVRHGATVVNSGGFKILDVT
jgi:HK97 family phage major capsid protein